jgi:hypothetical protein
VWVTLTTRRCSPLSPAAGGSRLPRPGALVLVSWCPVTGGIGVGDIVAASSAVPVGSDDTAAQRAVFASRGCARSPTSRRWVTLAMLETERPSGRRRIRKAGSSVAIPPRGGRFPWPGIRGGRGRGGTLENEAGHYPSARVPFSVCSPPPGATRFPRSGTASL